MASPVQRNSPDDPEEFRATLGEHLDELRARIIRTLLIVSACWVVGWYLQPPVYDYLNTFAMHNLKSTPGHQVVDAFNSFTGPFMLKMRISFVIALVLAFPFIILQLWGFIAPGLRPSERKPLKKIAPLTAVLFCLGVIFSWIILPSAFGWFVSYLGEFNGASLFQEPGTMVFFILKMFLAFGVGFQLPLIVYFLASTGIVSPSTLTENWRQATVGIFVVAMIITPSNDIFSMLMMAIPLTLLFFASVAAVRLTVRKRLRAGGDADDQS